MKKTFIRHYMYLLMIYFLLSVSVAAQDFQILEYGKITKYFPLTEINTYEWQGYMWNKDRSNTQLYDYDNKINLIAVTFQNRGKSGPRNHKKYTFIYDDNNNLIEMNYFNYIDSSWEVSEKTMFSYNENDYCSAIEEYWYRWEDSTFVKQFMINNYYYSDNKLAQTLARRWDASKYVNFSNQLFYWDEYDKLILSESQKWEEDNWVNFKRIVFFDDKKENLSYHTEQIWMDSTWVDKIKIVKYYSEDGLLQETILSVWYNANWFEESKWINQYNPNNSIAEQYFFSKGTEVWSKKRKLEYIYREK